MQKTCQKWNEEIHKPSKISYDEVDSLVKDIKFKGAAKKKK